MSRRTRLKSGRSGFTLIEILTVIVIIGLLAGMISTAVLLAKKKALSVSRTAELATIKSALEAYRFEYQEWPCPEGAMTTPPSTATYKDNNNVVIDDWLLNSNPGRNERNVRFINVGDYRRDALGNLIDNKGDTYEIVFDFDNDKVSVN